MICLFLPTAEDHPLFEPINILVICHKNVFFQVRTGDFTARFEKNVFFRKKRDFLLEKIKMSDKLLFIERSGIAQR